VSSSSIRFQSEIPKLPTAAEVDRQMRERQPGLNIYNPTDLWLPLEVFGLTHMVAPPDLGGAILSHPRTNMPTVCDGMLEVKGRFPDQKDSSGKVITGQDAGSMIKYLVHEGQYGQMGLVWIPGIKPEEDEKLKLAAKQQWLTYQKKADEDIVEKRRSFKANWEKNPSHRGEPVPPPTEAESAAIERLQELKSSKSFMYNCDAENCPGYASNNWEKFSRHMEVAHRIKPKREMYDGQVGAFATTPAKTASPAIAAAAASLQDDDEEEPPHRPVGRPRKVQ
jgi:hypothetical protein